MKTLTPEVEAILESGHVTMVTAVSIEVDEATTIRVHNATGTYTIDGDDYLGVGGFGNIDPIKKNGSATPEGISLSLSGIDTTLLSDVLNEGYQGRPVKVYLVLIKDDGTMILANNTFVGRLDTMNITIGETATVVCNVENRLVDWKRGNVSRYNNIDHQKVHPTDKFFEFIEQVTYKKIRFDPWMQKPDD